MTSSHDRLHRTTMRRRAPWVRPVALALAAAAVAAVALLGGAGAASAGPPVAAGADEQQPGPHFYSGSDIEISGTVDGDVYAAGQSITISGDVTGDVIAAAQTITVTGQVDGDVRLAAQDIVIDGTVARSGTLAASSIAISDRGSFGADVVGAASRVEIAGDIGRDLQLSVDRLAIVGTVGGDLTYSSDQAARIGTRSVEGVVDHVQPAVETRDAVSPAGAITGWLLGLVYALVALSLVVVVIALLLPRWLGRVSAELTSRPWRALLVGFLAGIVAPGVFVALLATIVGAPLAAAATVVWVMLLLATFPIAAYSLGRLIFRGVQRPVLTALLGGAVLIVALHIPWLNVLVGIAVLLFGLGAQLVMLYDRRPWRAASGGGADKVDANTNTTTVTPPVVLAPTS